ncbi:hypothetical protein VitviT2T_017013 [Vitis vinifera]|uniref:Uncharacterized protein n=1 Tax=Vitis vinifera TaxID=29760 RepID=A0ABY9CV38_VITVI|nr:hypothetical protein VitviT2T_017013 [Vitis vinifera]
MPMRRNVVFQSTMINMYEKERDFVEMLSLFSECLTVAIPSGRHPSSTRISHSRNSIWPTSHFHPDISAAILSGRHPTSTLISHSRNSIRQTFHLLRIFQIRRLPPDGR